MLRMRCGLMGQLALRFLGQAGAEGLAINEAIDQGASLDELMYLRGLLNELTDSSEPALEDDRRTVFGKTTHRYRINKLAHRRALALVNRVLNMDPQVSIIRRKSR